MGRKVTKDEISAIERLFQEHELLEKNKKLILIKRKNLGRMIGFHSLM